MRLDIDTGGLRTLLFSSAALILEARISLFILLPQKLFIVLMATLRF